MAQDREAALVEAIFQGIEATSAHMNMTYLTTPITTGLAAYRFATRHREIPYREARNIFAAEWANVLRANVSNAQQAAMRFMDEHATPVINPAVVNIKLSQDSYDQLWSRVIGSFATQILLGGGWAYSRGCREEVRLGLNLGIPFCNERGIRVLEDDLKSEISEANSTLRESGWSDLLEPLPSITYN